MGRILRFTRVRSLPPTRPPATVATSSDDRGSAFAAFWFVWLLIHVLT